MLRYLPTAGLLLASCASIDARSPSPPSASPGASGPPIAAVRPVIDTYFGTAVSDPYRWMERLDAPETQAFLRGQADHARRVLDALPLRKALLERITALDRDEALVLYARRQAGKLFYEKCPPGAEDRDLFVREGQVERKLLSMASLARGEVKYAIDAFEVSPDGAHVAVGVSPAGSEDTSYYIVDVAAGKLLPDLIPRVPWGGIRWVDARSVFYEQRRDLPAGAAESERYTRPIVKLHHLGDDAAKDRAIFGFGYSPRMPFTPDDDFLMLAAAGSPWVLGTVVRGAQSEQEIYAARASELEGRGEIPWRRVVGFDGAVTDLALHGDDLYLMTHAGAPRFALTRLSLKEGAGPAEVVVPEGEGVMQGVAAAADALYLNVFEGAASRVVRVPYGGGKPEPLPSPFPGTIRTMLGQPGDPGVVFYLRGWAQLARTFGVDPAARRPLELGLEPQPSIDTSSLTVSFLTATSKDGTAVPLTVVHRSDVPRDGARPAWLDVYGAYGASNLPIFWPGRMAWLERGAVFAVCHARGGGERGDAWHAAATREKRQRTVDDLLGCAEKLGAERLSAPSRIAAVGKSAGGLPVGLALVQQPDRFGAYFIDVGLTNVLRMGETSLGPASGEEYGALGSEAGFRALLAADVYTQVAQGASHPPVLLTAGMRDARIPAWEPAKMAARLQALTRGRTLLRVDAEGGHFSERRADGNAQLADVYAFLLDALGKPAPAQ